MAAEIIFEQAEEKMMEALQDNKSYQAVSQGVLISRFSSLNAKFDSNELIPLIQSLLPENKRSRVFFCKDGDVMFSWKEMSQDSCKNLKSLILEILKNKKSITSTDSIFSYYDFNVNNQDIWSECQKKINAMAKIDINNNNLAFTEEQKTNFTNAVEERKTRQHLVILVVEDELVSCKLLKQMIVNQYKSKVNCFVATNYSQAINIYANYAPNMVFQDIELPMVNGHLLAAFYNTIDKEANIIMLTANNYADDIIKAKQNNVKNFIIKPYDKQRIIMCINDYIANTKR